MSETSATPSAVTAVPAAEPSRALAHFEGLLELETDCWDVHDAIFTAKQRDFVLLDVRSPDAYASGHVETAVNLPHEAISHETLAAFDGPTGDDRPLFVVYCWGPHCNGADKAAVVLARLGRPVKKMIGGVEGWKDEGFELVT